MTLLIQTAGRKMAVFTDVFSQLLTNGIRNWVTNWCVYVFYSIPLVEFSFKKENNCLKRMVEIFILYTVPLSLFFQDTFLWRRRDLGSHKYCLKEQIALYVACSIRSSWAQIFKQWSLCVCVCMCVCMRVCVHVVCITFWKYVHLKHV